MSKSGKNYCLNCETDFVEGSEYCYVCGQSKKASILSFGEMWNNLWTSIFNVDNSFFTTLRLIARPDKLTDLYVSGKRKRHIHPIRLFIVSSLFFIAAVFSTITVFENDTFLERTYRDYYYSLLLEKYENIIDKKDLTDEAYSNLHELKEEVFKGVKCKDQDYVTNAKMIIDVGRDDYDKITKHDLLYLTVEEAIEKYEIEGFTEKRGFRQFLRINKNPTAAGEYIFTNALWGMIPCILLVCLVLKLLYRNFKISYLEHLVFVANTHSFIFLFWMSVVLLIKFFVNDYGKLAELIPLALVINLVFVYFMMHLYYKEGILMTLLKFVIAVIIYGISGTIFLVVTTVATGFIF